MRASWAGAALAENRSAASRQGQAGKSNGGLARRSKKRPATIHHRPPNLPFQNTTTERPRSTCTGGTGTLMSQLAHGRTGLGREQRRRRRPGPSIQSPRPLPSGEVGRSVHAASDRRRDLADRPGNRRASSGQVHTTGARAHTHGPWHTALLFFFFPFPLLLPFISAAKFFSSFFFSALCETQTLKLAGIIRFTLAFSRLLRRRCSVHPKTKIFSRFPVISKSFQFNTCM